VDGFSYPGRMEGNEYRPTPPAVLYLGGQARSGSTLLDRALGQVPGFCSSGEVRYLWDRGLAENQRCGCGVPLRACPFWDAVGRRAWGGWDRIDLDEVLMLQRRVDRMGAMPALTARTLAPRFAAALERYGAYLSRVFSAIRDESGAQVVVDSSMSPPHGLVLSRVEGIDLRLVHLVRDARGVAHSSMKVVERPEVTDGVDYMPTYSPLEATARWSAANLTFELLGRSVPDLRLRYESFVRDPRGVLAAIADHMGVSLGPDDLSFVTTEKIELGVNHTAAGNPMRFKTGTLPLRVDEAWRDNMSSRDRRVVTTVAWPLLSRYGYLQRGDPEGPA
jgi:hypothetical protein